MNTEFVQCVSVMHFTRFRVYRYFVIIPAYCCFMRNEVMQTDVYCGFVVSIILIILACNATL